ncbi:MAG: hypothetical protein JWO36_71 [Myxococcales bacterium]|nr:hypothetical protein [Myxococcales bacterium]
MKSFAVVALVFASTAIARAQVVESQEKPAWGMGVKVRRAWVTPYVQKLFMGDVPGTATMDGAGLDFTRRTGSSEVVFGFGYDRLDAIDGYYLEKGGDPLVPGKVDYVTFHNPHWWTAELSIINHAQIHKFLEFRYGAGIGLGLIRGTILKTSAICTGSNIQQDCMPDPAGMLMNHPADIPPVLPVVNILVGLQFRPFEFLHIHLDAGLHTVPYVTLGATLYLW